MLPFLDDHLLVKNLRDHWLLFRDTDDQRIQQSDCMRNITGKPNQEVVSDVTLT